MSKRFVAAAGLAVVLSASSALAHNPSTATDCDTWSRTGHGTPSHHHNNGVPAENIDNPQDLHPALPNQALPVTIHRHTGHYVVRDNAGSSYFEVVGGGGYIGDGRVPQAGEGGYEQGRLDAAGHEVDFHHDAFGPLREDPSPPLWWQTSTYLCVSVDNTKVETPRVAVDCPPASGQCH